MLVRNLHWLSWFLLATNRRVRLLIHLKRRDDNAWPKNLATSLLEVEHGTARARSNLDASRLRARAVPCSTSSKDVARFLGQALSSRLLRWMRRRTRRFVASKNQESQCRFRTSMSCTPRHFWDQRKRMRLGLNGR